MSGGTVGVRGTAAECRKFAPNIFNKSKCSSCFKQKEEHSAEALECNRATRKISKCGYLFVAPGWDFSNPLNRTKRWQRRWFVLYDDGELTYSVDEHPETVPQARIDMTRVLEVAAAEDVTGHPNSLAITSPEGVTFVKGTCREETRWWADVLQVYSRNKGRHKRNATFPGGQTTILQVTPTIRSNTPNPPRPRFNSCRSEPTRTGSNSWLPEATGNGLSNASARLVATSAGNDVLSNGVGDVATSSTRNENGLNAHSYLTSASGYSTASQAALSAAINGANNLGNVYSNLPTIGSNVTSGYVSSSTTPSTASLTSSLAEKPPMIPNDVRQSTSNTSLTITSATTTTTTTTSSSSSSSTTMSSSNASSAYRDQPASSASPPTRDKLRAEDKARRRMNQQAERRGANIAGPDQKLEDDACRRILLEHEREREGKLRDIAASLTQPRVRRNKPRISEPTRDVVDAANAAHRDKLIRGDPDGCGLDMPVSRYSPTSELRVDLPAEDLLNIKKGWLMKQSANKEWNKHWFVLRGCGLMYYRDPCAEDKGIMDGVIDLNTVTAVTSLQVARNYGFQTVAWDERGSTVLSAVTAGIRASWMTAIRRAANLPEVEEPESHGNAMQDNQQEAKPQSPTASITDRESSSAIPSASVTPRSVLFSSDEEYRTASEGGRRESGDWSELPLSPPLTSRNGSTDWPVPLKLGSWPGEVVGSGVGNHEWSELPPSPPLTRTALSRVKARSRSSSRSRVYKRSRSSPPSSRRSTLDSVGSEDLVMACCELRDEADRNDTHARNNDCLPNADEDETLRKNPLIVDLLESQVTLLRDHLEQSQSQPSALLVIVERQASEIESLRSQLNATRTEVLAAEKELSRLRQQKAEAAIREKQLEEMLGALQRSEQQRTKDIEELEKMKKLYNRDKENLECKLLETETILRESSERCEVLTNELASSHRTVEHLQNEVDNLSDRLSRGIEENERLYNKVRELEGKGSLSAARERGRSFDSLSDLTNIDLDLDLSALDKERIMDEYDELRSRFEKAILEIRAMRKELREAHATQDALELEIIAHKQSAASASETNASQTRLMAARIQDLTSKLGASEKQARALRQKLTKAETRDKRRSLSLKGREAMQISQEVEEKLVDLENKVRAIEAGRSSSAPPPLSVSSSKESSPNPRKEKKRDAKSLDRNRIRRKSLDSVTGNEPIKFLIRLNNLETRVANVTENNSDAEKDSSECSEVSASSGSEVSTEVLSRLRKLERAVARSKRRLEKCLGSTQAEDKAEKCLREVNEILESCTDMKRGQTQIPDSVGVLVSRLEGILTEKLSELTSRRRTLAESGELNERAKTRLLAERMAYETVVLSHLKSAASRGNASGNALLAELAETSQLVAALRRKVRGARPKPGPGPTFVHSLAGLLADRIQILHGSGSNEANLGNALGSENSMFLQRKQKEADDIVRTYKESKLKVLADALASETLDIAEQEDLGNKQTSSSGKKLLEDRRIREAWAVAQETVSKELVQLEVFNVITRCGEMYEQSVGTIADVCLNHQATPLELESWIDEAQARLRQEMELSIRELSDAYEEAIRARKTRRTSPNGKKDARIESRELLMEYADVIAHKALIDARIGLLREGTCETIAPGIPAEGFVSSLLRNEDLLACLAGDEESQGNSFEDPVRNAEYVYLYRKFARDCEDRVYGRRGSKEQLRNVGQVLAGLEDDLDGLAMNMRAKNGLQIDAGGNRNGNASTLNDWPSVCEKCAHLRARIKEISAFVESSSCGQCAHLQETIERMSREHCEELENLKRSQERDLMDIKAELDSQRHSLTTQYEQEAASLRERARKLEQRLNAMDSEHSAHVNELRAAYQRSISAELDTDAETRKRYKEEIKQLRALCEKGLLAMENSHRRIIADMEEKHRQELENLRVEKEQALSEETQATLAALDAMRKAHEHEVQKEIAKFKQEFVKQVQAREDIGTLHKEHEEEMEEIKREILSLSAKYSSKCVESAALEEKVGGLSKQLSQAQQHIMQLDARNKQLRTQLLLEASENGDAMEILRGRDNEIAEQRDEIHRLQQQLKHGESSLDTRLVKDAVETSPCVRAAAGEKGERGERDREKEGERDGEREKGDWGKGQGQGQAQGREQRDVQGQVQAQGSRQGESQGQAEGQGREQREVQGQGQAQGIRQRESQGRAEVQGRELREVQGQGQAQETRQRGSQGQDSGSLEVQGHVQAPGNRQREILGPGIDSLEGQGQIQGRGSGEYQGQDGQVSLQVRGPLQNPLQGSRAMLSTERKSLSADRPSTTNSGFSYRLERLKSISLPYASTLLPSGKPRERNGLGGPLWDSLRPRSGLPQQYQGGTAEMRLGGGGVGPGRAQEAQQQNKEQQRQQQQQRQQRTDLALTSRLTPEPPTLSVAELMRSPAVRWSSRSCRSLPPTPTPSYHHPLHPPLPAVGMVAERKKRFEL